MAVDKVFIHHEGAGSPTDWPRGADGGYTVWVGPSRFTILRPPSQDYSTIRHNHVSAGICLSGNRHPAWLSRGHQVTDTEIRLIGEACAELRRRGELTASPTVGAHRSVYQTACPGDRTMDRWGEIVAACNGTVTVQPSSGTSRPTVRQGSRGDDVRWLQQVLRDRAGQQIAVDGIFGPATDQAVRNLQRFFGLTVDGIVGPNTWGTVQFIA